MDDGNKLRNEVSKLTKQNLQAMKKYQLLEQAKAAVEGERWTFIYLSQQHRRSSNFFSGSGTDDRKVKVYQTLEPYWRK